MQDQIINWLNRNSPINPLFIFAIFSIVVMFIVYRSNIMRWKLLTAEEKFTIIGGVLVILTLLMGGIVVAIKGDWQR